MNRLMSPIPYDVILTGVPPSPTPHIFLPAVRHLEGEGGGFVPVTAAPCGGDTASDSSGSPPRPLPPLARPQPQATPPGASPGAHFIFSFLTTCLMCPCCASLLYVYLALLRRRFE